MGDGMVKIASSLLALIGLVSAFGGYHLYMDARHELVESAKVKDAAILLNLESENQTTRNVYLKRLEKCEKTHDCSPERVEDAEAQLWRLDYDRERIKQMKQAVLGEVE